MEGSHTLTSPLFIVWWPHKRTGKRRRMRRKIVEMEYTVTSVQSRELRTPLGANGLSRFSVPSSTIAPARDSTIDWEAWEKWITREREGKGEAGAAESYKKTEGIKTWSTWGNVSRKNNITQRYYYPFTINKNIKRRQHVRGFLPFRIPLQNAKWLPS